MPQVLIPILIGVTSSVAGSLITRGLSGGGGSSTYQQPTAPSGPSAGDTARQAMLDRISKARAIRNELPYLQENLGGSVSPDYYATIAAILSGNADSMDIAKESANSYFGLTPGGIFSDVAGITGGGGRGGGGFDGLVGGGGGRGGGNPFSTGADEGDFNFARYADL